MYISGGENVFPGEVESVLTAHEAVSEAVVVGVSHPLWGEVGCAFILLRAGARVPTQEDIIAFARTNLAAYKTPKIVVIKNDFPRLGSGKPDRRALAALAPSVERQLEKA